MYPLFDFSWALPWLLIGFVLGALLVALTRWMSGGGSTVKATIQSLHDELSNARLEASKVSADNGHLNTALADAERRAAANSRLGDENARLARSEAEARNRAATLAEQIERFQNDLQTYNTRGTSLEAEVQRLRAENASLKSSWDNNVHQFNTMRSDLAAAEAKIRDFDLIRLKLDEAHQQLSQSGDLRAELEGHRAEIARLQSSANQMAKTSVGDANALVAAEQEIMRLKGALTEADSQLKELADLRQRLQASEGLLGQADAMRAEFHRLSTENTSLRAQAQQAAASPAYSDALAAAEREIARLKTAASYGSGGAQSPELDRVKADLAAANAALAAAKSDLEKAAASAGAPGGGKSVGEFNAVMTDLTATRNLSIVQARELQHLRSEVARLSELAAGAAGDEGGSSSGLSYADAPMSGRYTDRPLVSTRSSGLRSRFRGWRNPGGVENEIALLRAKVEQQEEELRRLTRKD